MQVTETMQVKVTLTQKEYAAIMEKAKARGFANLSEMLKKAVMDFCEGGNTPANIQEVAEDPLAGVNFD